MCGWPIFLFLLGRVPASAAYHCLWRCAGIKRVRRCRERIPAHAKRRADRWRPLPFLISFDDRPFSRGFRRCSPYCNRLDLGSVHHCHRLLCEGTARMGDGLCRGSYSPRLGRAFFLLVAQRGGLVLEYFGVLARFASRLAATLRWLGRRQVQENVS